MADTSFLGKGVTFPFQINPATGRFAMSAEEKSVKESIYIILMTNRSERFMRPAFGSTIMSFTFIDVNSTTINMMRQSIISQILTQEPRVSDVDVSIDPQTDKGRLMIDIQYTVAQSNTKGNLVFPFYLNAANEEAEELDAYGPESYSTDTME